MAGPTTPYELESLIRSAAMAPLPKETAIKLLREYQALLRRHEELEALMERLKPAWGEMRAVLGEMGRELRG